MSDSALPNDPSLWPTDPYALLGLKHGCSPLDLKRAYTRLVKQFKPEHSPEQFRLIRTAYENLQHRVEYHYRFSQEIISESPASPETSVTLEITPTTSDTSDSPDSPTEPVASPEQPLEPWTASRTTDDSTNYWNLAIAGDDTAAYKGLLQKLSLDPQQGEVYARLYWLLRLNPDLDTERPAGSWLAEGVCSSRQANWLLELFRAEVDRDPSEATASHWDRVLYKEMDGSIHATFLTIRWQGASAEKKWNDIIADLDVLRGRIVHLGEDVWLRLMSNLYDRVAWKSQRAASPLCEVVRQEIAKLNHLGIHQTYHFDRMEYLDALVSGHQEIYHKNVSAEFLYFVRVSWFLPFEAVRRDLEVVLLQIDSAPHDWLNFFSQLGSHSAIVITHFDQMLDYYLRELDEIESADLDLDQLRKKLRRSLKKNNTSSMTIRGDALRFCLHECIIVDDLIAAVNHGKIGTNNPSDRISWMESDMASRLQEDLTLQIITKACRAFRA